MHVVNDNSKRLSKSGIEYLDRVWNFSSGCENKERGICPIPNCWARSIIKRFPDPYPHGFEPTLYPSALLAPLELTKPSRIGICFMGDLFGDWVNPLKQSGALDFGGLKDEVFFTLSSCPQHQFFFLTKCPWNYQKWDKFPDNAWVGATVCNQEMYNKAVFALADVRAKHKWLSIEPLMGEIFLQQRLGFVLKNKLDWMVTGGWSGGKGTEPKKEWILGIVKACDKAGIPVWLKNNLRNIMSLRQELPRG